MGFFNMMKPFKITFTEFEIKREKNGDEIWRSEIEMS